PWVKIGAASADAISEVVLRCPSGALHVERKDGSQGEAAPAENTIYLKPNSHLRITGNIAILAYGVEIEGETRATLCRCGGSQNKPFCDNSHRIKGFQAPEPPLAAQRDVNPTGTGGILHIRA
ncbi:MAG: CDGSH iron-sulfur domain-containing protein, partial [Anaerolineales bacterium]